jgi:hypothetical protein
MKDIKNLSEQEVRDIVSKFDAQLLELRKAIKAEGDRINAEYALKLQAGQRVHLESVESYASLSNKFRSTYSARDPYARKLEKFDKINRKNAREAKKNSKEVEQKRIEGLASNLRKLLAPVEKALAESIIEQDNERLKNQNKFFKSLKKPYIIKFTYGCFARPNKKDEFSYSDFRLEFGRFWDTKHTGFGSSADPLKVSKKPNLSEKIETDAKAYAKSACDSFACKIVVKTEQEIASRKSSEKIVSTSYNGSINPWDGGKVIVKTDKSEYVWNTKVILNFSKHGLPFNQWPTRLQK